MRTPILPFAALVLTGTLGLAQTGPPVANTGGNVGNDYVVDCNNVFAPGSALTTVQLDGSASYDPDGTPVAFWWFEECPFGSFVDPFSPTPVFQVDMTGECQRSCVVELRVISGGQTTKQVFSVDVADVSPPLIYPLVDVIGIWGDDTSPLSTGMPMLVDNCDPAPALGYVDVLVPQGGIGFPESLIERTWLATDCMGLESSYLQRITLIAPTGPAGSSANLDVDPSGCPNFFHAGDRGTIDVLLLGSPEFKAENVIESSVRLWIRTQPNVMVGPSVFTLGDVGSISAGQYGECNSGKPDGRPDLNMSFNRGTFTNQLNLRAYAPGAVVEVMVSGKLLNGKLWATRDSIEIR